MMWWLRVARAVQRMPDCAILLLPSFWFVCESVASAHLIGARIDEAHHRADQRVFPFS